VTNQTESEALFEQFCAAHKLSCTRYGTSQERTPDYRLTLATSTICVEIKQIESEAGLIGNTGTRTVGDHVRARIEEARGQMQTASRAGFATLLLIYNKVDPHQVFGTEPHDFISAMYGEWTVRLRNGRIAESFHGRNAKLRHNANTSFSAVGHLCRTEAGARIKIFENAFARHSLPYEEVPGCFDVVRVEVENAA
jgi:hypothetical protein